jgi:hypothetical protein
MPVGRQFIIQGFPPALSAYSMFRGYWLRDFEKKEKRKKEKRKEKEHLFQFCQIRKTVDIPFHIPIHS